MTRGSTHNTAAEKLSLLVEVIGPAGAGKTTLLRALTQGHEKIQLGIRPSKTGQIPFLITNTCSMLPTYLRSYRHSRWFSWRETRMMLYLKAAHHVFRQQALNNNVITLLELGPMYRLAFLGEFGPELTTSARYARWCANLFSQWAAKLDMIIWLDAPNIILQDRVRRRANWHPIKDKNVKEAEEYLTRYRTAMEQIIMEAVTGHAVPVLRFDTTQTSVDQIVDVVLPAFDAVRRR